MKTNKLSSKFTMRIYVLCALLTFSSCSNDSDEPGGDSGSDAGGNKEIVVTVSEDGKVSGNNTFSAIDDKNFYINDIKYTVVQGHLEVSGYDKTAFSGPANIISTLVYKSNTYKVLSIKDEAFSGCKTLTDLTIPETVTKIGSYAFGSCRSLKSVYIPSSITYMGDNVFFYCEALTSVSLPDNLDKIPEGMFDACHSLTSITIPSSVTYIGLEAFQSCESLKSINIPDKVTYLGPGAFAFCEALTSVTIPASVINIDSNEDGRYEAYEPVFAGCSSLTSINVAKENKNYSSIDGVLFNKDASTLITYPGGKKGNYDVPSSVTKIEKEAFMGSGIKSITLPNGITTIDVCTFLDCASLISVKIPSSVTLINNQAFGRCTSLASIDIPKSVTKIGAYSFDGSGLTSVKIPDGVEEIGYGSFQNSSSLASVTIPSSVKIIDSYAFWDCPSITDVYMLYTTLDYFAWQGNNKIKNLHVLPGCKEMYEEWNRDRWENIFENIIEDAKI